MNSFKLVLVLLVAAGVKAATLIRKDTYAGSGCTYTKACGRNFCPTLLTYQTTTKTLTIKNTTGTGNPTSTKLLGVDGNVCSYLGNSGGQLYSMKIDCSGGKVTQYYSGDCTGGNDQYTIGSCVDSLNAKYSCVTATAMHINTFNSTADPQCQATPEYVTTTGLNYCLAASSSVGFQYVKKDSVYYTNVYADSLCSGAITSSTPFLPSQCYDLYNSSSLSQKLTVTDSAMMIHATTTSMAIVGVMSVVVAMVF